MISIDRSYSCGISVEGQGILIGGYPSTFSSDVSVYDESGLVESLPDLNTGRRGAACGYYLDQYDRKVTLMESKN